ncbi:MAG: hypothetical protein PARBB_00800 [Parabacteroides distasonis]
MDHLHSWKNDVAVLLIFFVRDDVFEKTFTAVKEARPRKLLLFQDGPRNMNDIKGIERCRKIAENIDWECEVYRNYQKDNLGCDPATFYSHKWAFSIVDKCIILEDDCVPSQSFFPFCKELLDRYEFDTRINRICGMNHQEVTAEVPTDYFFCSLGSVWGWATWKRVADTWEDKYEFMQDKFWMNALRLARPDKNYTNILRKAKKQSTANFPYWETINTYARIMYNQLVIVPKYNMISNIGVSENATHALSDIRLLPRLIRKNFNIPQYNIKQPIKHPKYIINYIPYIEYVTQKSPWYSRIESIWLRIRYKQVGSLWKGLKHKLGFAK